MGSRRGDGRERCSPSTPALHLSLSDLQFLEDMQHQEEKTSQLWDLALSLTAFCSFWLLGALCFKAMEETWSYADSLYFCYVFFLT